MNNEMSLSEELAATRQELNEARKEIQALRTAREAVHAAKIEPWQLASHMIGRQQVDYLSERGLAIVSKKEFRDFQAMKEKANITGE